MAKGEEDEKPIAEQLREPKLAEQMLEHQVGLIPHLRQSHVQLNGLDASSGTTWCSGSSRRPSTCHIKQSTCCALIEHACR